MYIVRIIKQARKNTKSYITKILFLFRPSDFANTKIVQ